MNSGRKLKPVMFVGTSSGVGKSTLAAGFCRIFLQDGYRPAPFKAQNMSLNSFITPDGSEIGRAQAVQAEAAGIQPGPDMNPVLLKPTGKNISQVILRGQVEGNLSAREYFRDGKQNYFELAAESFRRLEREYNPIVLEGAGGIVELNLKSRDIVNLSMAREANAAVYLIADIERGGVFASVYGTLKLLSPEDRALIRGVIVNQFRGDGSLFEDGRKILEDLAGVPVLGVLPHLENLDIDEEDSLDIVKYNNYPIEGAFNIAVLKFRHLSNYTDFDFLSRISGVNVYYTDRPDDLEGAGLIILPGTKNTIDDLREIEKNGCGEAIRAAAKRGTAVMGICGGYQMLGDSILDPEGIESKEKGIEGLGLIPMRTVLQYPKVTRQVEFRPIEAGDSLSGDIAKKVINGRGYEIHMGRSEFTCEIDPLFRVSFQRDDGDLIEEESHKTIRGESEHFDGIIRGKILGTYIHGCLDEPRVVSYILNTLLGANLRIPGESVYLRRERGYDRLANHIRSHVDIDAIYHDLFMDSED